MTEEKTHPVVSIVCEEHAKVCRDAQALLKGQLIAVSKMLEGKFRGVFKHPDGFVFVGKFTSISVSNEYYTRNARNARDAGAACVDDDDDDDDDGGDNLDDNDDKDDNDVDDEDVDDKKENGKYCTEILITVDPETGELVSRPLTTEESRDMKDHESLQQFRCCKDLYCRISKWNKTPYAIVLFSSKPLMEKSTCCLVECSTVWGGVIQSHLQDNPGWKFQDLVPRHYVTLSMFPQYTVKQDRVPVIDCRE